MAQLLWEPSEQRIKSSNMYRFMHVINKKYSLDLADYNNLYKWSIQNIPDFWESIWDCGEIKASTPFDQVVDDLGKMPGARWFSGARLNFAENLLRYRDMQPAIIFKGEHRESIKISYTVLYNEVARLARSLRGSDVQPGNRVAGFMPNLPETIIARLAATSIGAIWSSCSPDFGIKEVLDRFGQIKPKILFTADGYFFKGNRFDSLERISNIIKELPSIKKAIVVPYTTQGPNIENVPHSILYSDFRPSETGLPQSMVHGAGGSGLNGCFAMGNPMGPVYAGELVCTAPLPSMPLYFWNGPDDKKYHSSAYFEVYPET